MDGDADRHAGATGETARRPRRRRTGLSRADVLGAAMVLVDADGVEALSMRRLGAALGRDPMRLDRYASSKEDLLDGERELDEGLDIILVGLCPRRTSELPAREGRDRDATW